MIEWQTLAVCVVINGWRECVGAHGVVVNVSGWLAWVADVGGQDWRVSGVGGQDGWRTLELGERTTPETHSTRSK